MKKKITGFLSLAIVLVSALFLIGFLIVKNANQKTNGNKLNVEWYAEDGTEFEITTSEQLFELASLSKHYDFEGQTIKLGCDIVVNEGNANEWNGSTILLRRWRPIENFAGTFDGQGHSISGIYGKFADGSMALFTNTKSSCVIQNFKLVNSYFHNYSRAGIASIATGGGGTFKRIYSDAIIDGKFGLCGGIIGRVSDQTIVEECQYSGTMRAELDTCGGIVGGAFNGKISILHCLFDGKIVSEQTSNSVRVGGIVGDAKNEDTILKMSDCLSAGEITVAVDSYVGAVAGRVAGSVNYMVDTTFGTYDCYSRIVGSEGSTGTPLQVTEKELLGYGSYQRTNLDFEDYWAVVENNTPTLQCFADEIPELSNIEKLYNFDW